MGSRTLQQALMPGGEAQQVTRIDFEVLENGRFRWVLWGEEGRLYCAVADADQIPAATQATGALLQIMLGIKPEPLQRGTNG